jgi:hypothetical protein
VRNWKPEGRQATAEHVGRGARAQEDEGLYCIGRSPLTTVQLSTTGFSTAGRMNWRRRVFSTNLTRDHGQAAEKSLARLQKSPNDDGQQIGQPPGPGACP